MRTAHPVALLLGTSLIAACAGSVSAQETILKNDGYVDGQSVGFQAGFAIGEMAASRFLPADSSPRRLNRVQFLFGGSTTTETITLHIWNDGAGTSNPGVELFSGDYTVTGSSTVLQEIDLTASNVVVTGPFRVGFEFQHDGYPSVARDGDGTIQATRNFIYSSAWYQSNLFGLTGDWVIRAGVEVQQSAGSNAPDILSIADVGNDQGRQVRIRFLRSAQDQAGASTPILQYEVLRRVDPLLVTPAASLFSPAQAVSPSSAMLDGWDYVTSVPAHGDSVYSLVVPTLVDSSASQGIRWSAFRIRAATASPLGYFDSAVDSGYSKDNLPPLPPAAFSAAYSGGTTHLLWEPNSEPDLWYYKLHRGATAAFSPGPGNLIATVSDADFDDAGPIGAYYKLAAVDVNGNVSGYVLVTPQATTDVPAGALELALAVAGPNPARGGRVTFGVTLPGRAAARLELLDVSGRRVMVREVGALGAGHHLVEVSPEARLSAGLYLARLRQGAQSRTIKVVMTR